MGDGGAVVLVEPALPVAGQDAQDADVAIAHEGVSRGSGTGIVTAPATGSGSARSSGENRRKPMVCSTRTVV
jgi:hypothetical protein